jgi:branched-chain amino acid transport system ATP-binding protein
VSLEISAGEVVGLLGPNGAGKTTLLMTIAGLLPAQSGTVTVDGSPMKTGRPGIANRAGIVLVPDNRCLFTSLTVEENLKAAQRRSGPTPRDMLETFPSLGKRWDIRAGALSGGEQQMLVVARALIQEPRVLLLDELSMGLAPLVVEALFIAVRRIADERSTAVVLVEQHVGLALEVADRAAILNRGTIVLEGSANELAAQPDVMERAYFGVPSTQEGSE